MYFEEVNSQEQKAHGSSYSDDPPFNRFFDHFFRTHQWPGGDNKHDEFPALPTPPIELKPVIMSIVRAGYRAEAKRNHPDAGGSVEGMRALSEAKKWLETAFNL